MDQNTHSTPNWWMYHGDPAHTGYVNSGSDICSATVGKSLKLLHSLQLEGPILSVPAIVDGYIYVGVANSHKAPGSNGGNLYKIDIQKGDIEENFRWNILPFERDTHGFTGMGCTPALADGKICFSAFNGKFYCLDQNSLNLLWVTDLRNTDLEHNQPVSNILGPEGYPLAAGWSSPVVANGKVYVGMGEGENPFLFGFVYCMDIDTGNIQWIYCTCPFAEPAASAADEPKEPNRPNVLPPDVVTSELPPPFIKADDNPKIRGCSIWSSIAYDPDLNRIFCATGNPQPDSRLPSKWYSNGLLALDADSGEYKGFVQIPGESSYRPSDTDVDIGGSPTIFTCNDKKVVGIGCKNGCYMIVDAEKMTCLNWRQLLPYKQDGSRIPTVDRHPPAAQQNELNPQVSNAVSDSTDGENYSGPFGTAAFDLATGRLFIGMGGPNYHNPSPGIDSDSTPFMRAIDYKTLEDVWTLDDSDPKRYRNARPPMYTTAGECGLSSSAVVNDVVFCSTSKVSLYAFDVQDGTCLWQDDIGMQTDGYTGGYGYCMGPAIWGNYVVAGALVFGRDGGILKIYELQEP